MMVVQGLLSSPLHPSFKWDRNVNNKIFKNYGDNESIALFELWVIFGATLFTASISKRGNKLGLVFWIFACFGQAKARARVP